MFDQGRIKLRKTKSPVRDGVRLLPDVVVGAGRLPDALPGAGHDGLEGGGHLTLPVTEITSIISTVKL